MPPGEVVIPARCEPVLVLVCPPTQQFQLASLDETSVRAALRARAHSNSRRATSHALHLPTPGPRTRMPDAHASALAGLAPGRLLGFANAAGAAGFWKGASRHHATRPGLTELTLAAHPSRTRHRDSVRAKCQPCSARAREGQSGSDPDSPALHPLHSSRSSPALRRNGIGSMPGFRSFVPTAANCRDRQNSSCAPEEERLQRPRGFARPGGCRPRLPLAVSTASFRFAWLRETVRPHW